MSKFLNQICGIFLGSSLLFSCTSVHSTQSGAIGINRKQNLFISASQVSQESSLYYSNLLNKAKQHKALNTNPSMTQRVRNIAQRLIPHTKVYREDAPSWAWETNVVTDDEANASVLPGGKILVHTGLISKLNLTDDELAAVIGHEIAHALREHTREKISNQQIQTLGLGIVGAVAGLDKKQLELAQGAMALGVSLPNSRMMEQEADRMGLELMARAGYNPEGGVRIWEKMLAQKNQKGLEFLQTHPSEQSRINDLKNLVPIVMPLYLESKNQKRKS
jgi:predicted Zn-dependent protease